MIPDDGWQRNQNSAVPYYTSLTDSGLSSWIAIRLLRKVEISSAISCKLNCVNFFATGLSRPQKTQLVLLSGRLMGFTRASPLRKAYYSDIRHVHMLYERR